ncbi:MAG: transcriptional regulator GcvA [Rhodospirillales bacterium]|nr:transcriptional regulator GcvA [Rhodospirillales bacterium]
MARDLPPLNALKAFEAAARQLSFTRAAAELHVTQAAVSHQIKALEDRLGIPLFRRLNRNLLLTDAGQALLPAVSDALDRLAAAVARVRSRDVSGVLTVSTLDSFAGTWLVRKLGRFRDIQPEIDVRITTSDHQVDFAREDVDMAIRYGRGPWPGLYVERLMTEEVFPVCSPALLKKGPPLKEPADLRHYTLLHDDLKEDWRMWLAHAGVSDIDPTRGHGFHRSNLVIQAAVAGAGVALGRSVLVADELASGQLVKPFALSLPAEFAYYLVCPFQSAERPKVRAFSDWLLAEARDQGGSRGGKGTTGA